MVIMSRIPVRSVDDPLPMLNQIFWDRYGLLPRDILFLTVAMVDKPHAGQTRYEVTKLYESEKHGSVTQVIVNFGFMEDPNVERTLRGLAAHHEVPIDEDSTQWLVHVVHERIFAGKMHNSIDHLRFSLYQFLQRNSDTADHYFGLGVDQPLTIEVVPVHLK
jgi:KUP system potassium uptake protein